MLIAVLGVMAGLLLGYYFPVSLPAGATPYILTLLCAAAYSALYGARVQAAGLFFAREFAQRVAASAIYSLLLCWLGVKLDLPVYLAAVTALCYMGFREIELLTGGGAENNKEAERITGGSGGKKEETEGKKT